MGVASAACNTRGSANPERAKFCGECGASLGDTEGHAQRLAAELAT